MNRTLRSRHRTLVTLAAVTLPALFGLALLSRAVDPRVSELPFAPHADVELGRVRLSPSATELEMAIVTEAEGSVVLLRPVEDLRSPDVLAYWVTEPSLEGADPDRYLLGALAGTQLCRWRLPPPFDGHGTIELVSLAHGRRLGGVEVSRLVAASREER